MKKLLVMLLVSLLIVTSCTQYVIGSLPDHNRPGNVSEDINADNVRSLISALDEQLPGDMEAVMNNSYDGTDLQIINEPVSSSRSAFSARAENRYEVTFRFDEYTVDGYGIIESGTFTTVFTGSSESVDMGTTLFSDKCSMNFFGLEVRRAGEANTETVEITDLEGLSAAVIKVDSSGNLSEVSGLSSSLSISKSMTTTTTITVDKSEVPSQDIADGNTSGDFTSGLGSESFPFIISSANEFLKIGDEKYFGSYFELGRDITVPAETMIKFFNGVLDGNGHSLNIDGTLPVEYKNNYEYCLIEDAQGEIKNLDFHTTGFKALVYQSSYEKPLTFNNVDVYGEMNGADSNVGPFIIYLNYNSTLTFQDCDNYANIIDLEGGGHYGAAFIGAYPLTNLDKTEVGGSVIMDNCHNYGTLFFGKWAAFIFGNANKYEQFIADGGTITVTNSTNNGDISAVEEVGFINHTDGVEASDTADGGTFRLLDPNYVTSFTVSADGTPSVEVEGDDFEINYSVTTYFYYPNGSRTITYPVELSEDGRLPVKAVQTVDDNLNGTIALDETTGNYIIYADPDSYDMGTGGSVSESIKFNALVYENGHIQGSKTCSISN